MPLIDAAKYVPNADNDGRWSRVATDHRCSRALKDKRALFIEIPELEKVYVASYKNLTILRSQSFGGDTFSVECGWVYSDTIRMGLDLLEINRLKNAVKRV